MAFVLKNGEDADKVKMGHWFQGSSMLMLKQWTHYFNLRTKRVSPSNMGEFNKCKV
jgi:hypothetical protein